MTKTNYEDLKKKIYDKLTKEEINKPEIILVSGGCLVQLLGNKDQTQKAFEALTSLHSELPKHESSFPYQIYFYKKSEDAYNRDVSLKTKAHDYESGVHTTYLLDQDAIVKMREIDIDALMYGEIRPFTFTVKSPPSSELFSISMGVKYKELDIGGGYYGLENAKIEKCNEGESDWKVTLF